MTMGLRGQARQVEYIGIGRATQTPLLSDAVALRPAMLRPQRSHAITLAFGAIAAAALSTLVVFVAPFGSADTVTAPAQEQAPAVEQTASLPVPAPAPEMAPAPSMLAPPQPSELDSARGQMPSEEPAPASTRSSLTPVPSVTLSPEEIATHLQKGDERVRAGDLAAARLYFDRVVRSGDPRGAVAMAKTYDPDVLGKLPIIGLKGDGDAAQAWYERAQIMQAAL
jgi:hypothetical protein